MQILKGLGLAGVSLFSGLVLKGRYLPRAALEAMKQASAQAYAAQALQPLSAALDPHHLH